MKDNDFLTKAYMGEHLNIQPESPQKRPLTRQEKLIYTYIKKNPNYTMPEVCRKFGLCQMDYIEIKRSIADKGYKINGAISKVCSDYYDEDDEDCFEE